MPKTNIKVKLLEIDGNSTTFDIIEKIRQALEEGGRKDLVEKYTEEVAFGVYDCLLQISREYVEIDIPPKK